jgi:hypothetical protein
VTEVPQNSHGTVSPTELPHRVIAWPSTYLGRWSLKLLAGFVALMGLFFVTISLYGGLDEVGRLSMQAGGRFFSLPWLASTLVAAVAAAVAAAGAALTAIIRKRERSLAMLLPLVIGGIVLLFAVGEMFEGR